MPVPDRRTPARCVIDVLRSTTRTVGSAPATPPSPVGLRRLSSMKSITATASLSDSYRCSLQPNSRGWSSRLRCDYIATAMTSLFVHWWGGCSHRCWGAMRWQVGFAEGCGWCHVASGWLVGFAGGSLSVGDVPKSGGLASLRSATVGGEPVRDLLPTLSVH